MYSPNRGKVLNYHTVLSVSAYWYILLMNRKHKRNTQPCCANSSGGKICRRLQEGSSPVVRCFCSLNWHLFRSTPRVCWVTEDSKPDASLERLSNDWVSVIPVSDVWYLMCIRVLALLLKNYSLPYDECHQGSHQFCSTAARAGKLYNYRIMSQEKAHRREES